VYASYDGAATVEGSTADELVLAPAPPSSPVEASEKEVRISSPHSMPILPVGAHVWLTRTGYGSSDGHFLPLNPWAISIRDRQAGRLLFGAFRFRPDLGAPAGTPITVGERRPLCERPTPDSCEGATVTYQSVDVVGDTTVAIDHGAVGTVTRDGTGYDVAMRAWSMTGPSTADFCADTAYTTGYTSSVGATVVAHDLAPLTAGLDVDPN
jgi:hypothetical protein